MWIIGCDFHSGFQQVAIFDNQTGELEEKKLTHPTQATEFYRGLQGEVRVGMESGVPCQWFRRLLHACGHQLWVGDAARIRAAETRAQKTDQRDAELILQLLLENRFPRIWMPTEEERDVRQLLMDRHHRMRMRTRVKNQLQALALNQGLQKGRRLWSAAGPGATGQAGDDGTRRPAARSVAGNLNHAGAADGDAGWAGATRGWGTGSGPAADDPSRSGAADGAAMVLTVGDVSRFAGSKQLTCYLGLTPREHSSGGKQRLGHISKQGSTLLRFLLVEAGQTAVRGDESLRRAYRR